MSNPNVLRRGVPRRGGTRYSRAPGAAWGGRMNDIDLNWRAEEACMNAWPAPRQVLLGGWLLRAAGGEVRRPNSVNPLRGSRGDLRGVLPVAEAVYGALGQTPLFRVPSFVDGMDDVLASAGYREEGRTLTLFSAFADSSFSARGDVEIAAQPGAAWLQARARWGGVTPPQQRIYETMLDSIVLPKAFGAARDGDDIAAIAYAVVTGKLAVIESVATDPARRRRGLGRRTLTTLLDWAQSRGAEAACLQVVADNTAAVSLYRGLGFTRELYRYRYFRKVPA